MAARAKCAASYQLVISRSSLWSHSWLIVGVGCLSGNTLVGGNCHRGSERGNRPRLRSGAVLFPAMGVQTAPPAPVHHWVPSGRMADDYGDNPFGRRPDVEVLDTGLPGGPESEDLTHEVSAGTSRRVESLATRRGPPGVRDTEASPFSGSSQGLCVPSRARHLSASTPRAVSHAQHSASTAILRPLGSRAPMIPAAGLEVQLSSSSTGGT
jgi:hypothetical protein